MDQGVVEHPSRSFGHRPEHVCGIAKQEIGLPAAGPRRFFSGADDERRFAALGVGNQQIAVGESQVVQLPRAELGVVLEIVDGSHEREIAAGDEREHLVREIMAAGPGRLFAPQRLEADAQAPRCSAAAQENPAAALQGGSDVRGHRFERGQVFRDLGHRIAIDSGHDPDRRRQVRLASWDSCIVFGWRASVGRSPS